MNKLNELKKLRFIIIPVICVFIFNKFFDYINPHTFNFNFDSPDIIYKSNFLLYLQGLFTIWIIFTWEFLIEKKWRETSIFFLALIIINFIVFYTKNLSKEYEDLPRLFFNVYGILIIIRAAIIKNKKNILIKYILGVSFSLLAYYGSRLIYNTISLIDSHNILYNFGLEGILLNTILYSFLFYYLFLFDNYTIREILKHYRNSPESKIERTEFNWNFILNYIFFLFAFYTFKNLLHLSEFRSFTLNNITTIITLIIILTIIVISYINIIIISKSWLRQNKRAQSWNLLLLFIPFINIIVLFIINNQRLNNVNIEKFKNETAFMIFAKWRNQSCSNFLLFIQILTTGYIYVTYFKIIKHLNNNIWLIIFLLLTATNLYLFYKFTKNKKILNFLVINSFLIFITQIFLGLQSINDVLSNMILSIMGFLFLINILHPDENKEIKK